MKHIKITTGFMLIILVLTSFVVGLHSEGQVPPSDTEEKAKALFKEADSVMAEFKSVNDTVSQALKDVPLSVPVVKPIVPPKTFRAWLNRFLYHNSQSEVAKDTAVETKKPVVNQVIQIAPVIPGSPKRTYPTYYQWKDGRGLFESKSLKKYNRIFNHED